MQFHLYYFASALASAIIGRIDASKAKQFEVTEKTGRSNDADLARGRSTGNEATRASRASRGGCGASDEGGR